MNMRNKNAMWTSEILFAALLLFAATPCIAAEETADDATANDGIIAIVEFNVVQVEQNTDDGEAILLRWRALPAQAVVEQNTSGDTDAPASEVRIADRSAIFGDALAAAARNDQDTQAALKVLTTPRIHAFIGQEASVVIGRSVPYLRPRDDGALELVETDERVEGIEIYVNAREISKPAELDSSGYLVDFRVRVGTVKEREPIAGVPFNVGRPIISTQELAATLHATAGEDVIIRLPEQETDGAIVFAIIRTTFRPVE
ncbi:MAG: hypothetical protein H6817_10705 [Phycisphaerales bacterium]|nr:hypothetical protein [Phycisphaerales bacterium]